MKTIQDLISHLETIPKDKWAIGLRGVPNENPTTFCVMGHIGLALGGGCFSYLADKWCEDRQISISSLVRANNGEEYCTGEKPDPTAKARTLNYLRSLL